MLRKACVKESERRLPKAPLSSVDGVVMLKIGETFNLTSIVLKGTKKKKSDKNRTSVSRVGGGWEIERNAFSERLWIESSSSVPSAREARG